jgi:hypothetical protein
MEKLIRLSFNNYQFAKTWKLIDDQGKCHRVKFNGDYCHPLFTNGWHHLRKEFSIVGNAQMMISYHGNNIFKVVVGPKITSSEQISPFHSRSTVVGQTIYVDHCINNKNTLVSAIFFFTNSFFSLQFFFLYEINIINILNFVTRFSIPTCKTTSTSI